MHNRNHDPDDLQEPAPVPADEDEGVEVPYSDLPPETLQRLMEEFVTRDGTDYGVQETPLRDRVAQLRTQLQAGRARILFSPRTQSVNIVPADR